MQSYYADLVNGPCEISIETCENQGPPLLPFTDIVSHHSLHDQLFTTF